MEIATEVVNPRERSRVAMPIFRERDAAHRAACGKPRVVICHAAAAILLLRVREM
jgi:hypothetical protein